MSRLVPFATLGLLCGAAWLRGPQALSTFSYARPRVLGGEAWRLLTTHFVHAGSAHLLWNLGGLALIALAVARELSARAWAIVIVTGAAGSSLGVLLLSPRTDAMAGLSALLHALLAGALVAALRRDRRVGIVLAVLLVAKLMLERAGVSGAGSHFGRDIAIDAHLYGAMAGAAAGFFLERRRTSA